MRAKQHRLRNQSWFFCVTLLCCLQTNRAGRSLSLCGNVDIIQNVIQSGNEATRGQWPFAVALYNLIDSQNFCGGSLISRKHVLTAAHCVQPKYVDDILSPLDLVAILGAHNITNLDQDGVVRANVAQIYVNPDWDPYTSSFDADVAVLVLNEIVQFTNYIRPICMPTDSADINSVTISVNGTIVGWGLTDNETSVEILRYASIESLNEYSCYMADEAMEIYSSNRTFCGRFGNGIPDYGDSGGGFFVVSNNAWVQYGIISVMGTDSFGRIGPNSISVYTNVKAFKNWIVETVLESDGRIWEPILEVSLRTYCGNLGEILVCLFDDFIIQKENVVLTFVNASIPHGQTFKDVELLDFRKGSMVSIPIDIGRSFPNIKAINVSPRTSMTIVMKESFVLMENLEQLTLSSPKIHLMGDNSLWHLTSLGYFALRNSKVRTLSEKLFDRNDKLRSILFESNHLLENVPAKLFQKLSQLTFVGLRNNSLKQIDEKTFATNTQLRQLDLSSNNLESLPGKLLENNSLLEILNLSKNFLKTIDERTFVTNSQLQVVMLFSNNLELLPKMVFRNNLLLERLDLEYNSLRTIEETLFVTNTNLSLVDLSSNALESLSVNVFKNNGQLYFISLGNNSIKMIAEETFKANAKLRHVDLAFNELEVLPRNLFQNNLLMQTIDFEGNSLKRIEIDFTKLSDVKKISFYNNTCINAKYDSSESSPNDFHDLTEFQNLLMSSCTPDVHA